MKQQHKIILIEGSFSPSDAREIVMKLISDKIKFHELKNFSSRERFGKDDLTSQKRLPELNRSLKTLIEIFDSADQSNALIKINSEINIQFENEHSGDQNKSLNS